MQPAEHAEEQALMYEISWLGSQNASLRAQLVQLQQQHHALVLAAATQQHSQMLATAARHAAESTAPSTPANCIYDQQAKYLGATFTRHAQAAPLLSTTWCSPRSGHFPTTLHASSISSAPYLVYAPCA
eukprot:3786454-Prymnesium_polylepis.1